MSHFCCIYFHAENAQVFWMLLEAPLSWLLYPFDMTPSLPEHCLALWHKMMFLAHLIFADIGPELAISSRSPFLLVAKWLLVTKVWLTGVLVAIRHPCSQPLSMDTAREYLTSELRWRCSTSAPVKQTWIC